MAEIDDRTALDLDEGCHWYVRQCRDEAALIANIVQAAMCAAEDAARELAAKDWLELSPVRRVLGAGMQIIKYREPRSIDAAAAHIAQCVREALMDNLSGDALEAIRVAEEG